MVGGAHTTPAAGVRDKRYSGQTLLVDLRDAEFDASTWSAAGFSVATEAKKFPTGLGADGLLTGVFSFEDAKDHGIFEARVETLDAERGTLGAHFMWVSDGGRKLLAAMAARPKATMRLAFTRRTANWSFSGFLLEGYHGALKDGERLRGMIWTDSPKDPGLFGGHAVHVNTERHTLAIKFDDLPDATFTLLERAIAKRDGAFSTGPKP